MRRLSAPRTPLNDAQKRAQNLRAYKADLQKLKKEQVSHILFHSPFCAFKMAKIYAAFIFWVRLGFRF